MVRLQNKFKQKQMFDIRQYNQNNAKNQLFVFIQIKVLKFFANLSHDLQI